LLEKEHYGEIMEKFLTINKNFLDFLCDSEEDSPPEQPPNFINMTEMKNYYEQQIRFIKKDNKHRSFIRAFMFDYIFKTFIQLLDECLG
jgi:hypothetical protein